MVIICFIAERIQHRTGNESCGRLFTKPSGEMVTTSKPILHHLHYPTTHTPPCICRVFPLHFATSPSYRRYSPPLWRNCFMKPVIELYDTTLRDGSQGEG